MSSDALRSADAEAARRVTEARWPDGIRCPHCNSRRATERHRPERRWPQWRCLDCRREFTAVTGTTKHGTRLSPSQVEQRQREERAAGSRDDDPARRFSRGAKEVLNALRQRPNGATVRKVAEITGISERHTRRVLHRLAEAGLARERDGLVRDGHRLAPKRLWELTYSPSCVRLLGHLPRQRAPMSAPPDSDTVPPQFWSLFWSGAEGAEVSLARDELHIAGTLIGNRDLSAEAWALQSVSSETLEVLANSRGYDAGDTGSLIRSELRSRRSVTA